ncbi:MAG: glycoside hydrolase family 28 protein [Firmicutes bacterium]|nr:glycoside hydrolase family 28 protein [Bacillota bacterium]
MYNILDFGAVKDGKTLCTKAINEALEKCSLEGGGKVYVPAGTFLTGPIYLKSNTELHLEAGATLLFTDDITQYEVVDSRWEGVLRKCYASLINAYNEENISLTGRGTLDGQGEFWWKLFRNKENEYPRPKMIAPYECKNVLIRDLTLKNSPSWTINTILCDNITIDNITIKNPYDSPNTDGIDPESCSNIHISNCHIDVGDDCIAIKAGTEDTEERVACKNIVIENCTMVHGHGGVVLGSEMSGSIVNVAINNCVFENTDRGIRLKSRRYRGGVVEDIRVNNVIMENVLCPFIANLYYMWGPRGQDPDVCDKNPAPVTKDTPAFRRLHFSNMTCKNVNASAGFFYGLAEMYVEDCTFENIYISISDNAKPGIPAMLVGAEEVKEKGFFLCNTRDIKFNNVTVVGVDGPAFEIENSENITLSNCVNKKNRSSSPLLSQKNCTNIKEDAE